ncbi:hypothetical protein U27_06968 [Candidatus Vecturithrix granuli]|uniref:Uncharacterized protein n=1 Tax=Vecturithrix granuli TaxID=1499967 RepID=A0A081C5X6_VECG1|nr:hypothetical protein U27_06968 [Candidatus Vecturithrix granuli]
MRKTNRFGMTLRLEFTDQASIQTPDEKNSSFTEEYDMIESPMSLSM